MLSEHSEDPFFLQLKMNLKLPLIGSKHASLFLLLFPVVLV